MAHQNASSHRNDWAWPRLAPCRDGLETMPTDECSHGDKPSHSEVRASIGSHLQEYYAAMKEMPLSDHLDSLLGQLKEAERSSPTESATEKNQNDSEQKTL